MSLNRDRKSIIVSLSLYENSGGFVFFYLAPPRLGSPQCVADKSWVSFLAALEWQQSHKCFIHQPIHIENKRSEGRKMTLFYELFNANLINYVIPIQYVMNVWRYFFPHIDYIVQLNYSHQVRRRSVPESLSITCVVQRELRSHV